MRVDKLFTSGRNEGLHSLWNAADVNKRSQAVRRKSKQREPERTTRCKKSRRIAAIRAETRQGKKVRATCNRTVDARRTSRAPCVTAVQ